MNKEDMNDILESFDMLKNTIVELQKIMYTNNLFALASNSNVPEDIRNIALDDAVRNMGYQMPERKNPYGGLPDDTCNM